MADKQIRIDITSRDDASDTLDDVADAVDKLEQADPTVTVDADTADADKRLDTVDELVDALDRRAAEVDITADTSAAESGLDDVEGQADDVARLDPEVVVTADVDDATRGIDDVKTEADTLTDADREIVLKAKISDAKGALKDLRGDLEQTADKADDTRTKLDRIGDSSAPSRVGGNIASDITGPLGDASTAASDFGGIFDGLSDITEGVGTRIGRDLSGIVTGLGTAGLAVGAVAAGWGYFSQKAEEAKRKAEEAAEAQREINEALKEGDAATAAEKFRDAYKDIVDAADDAGVSVSQLTEYIRGSADTFPDLDKALDDNTKALDEAKQRSDAYYESTGFMNQGLSDQIGQLVATGEQLGSFRDRVEGARRKNTDLNGTIKDQDRQLAGIREGLGKTARKTDDLTDAQKDAKDATEDLDEALGKLKDQLSFERTLNRFRDDFREALKKVREGRKVTSDDILTLKEDVLDVAEFAKLNPAEVQALLKRIKQGDIKGVRDDVQSYLDDHAVHTPAGLKLLPNAARDTRNQAQTDMDKQPDVVINTRYGQPVPGGTSGPGNLPQPQLVPIPPPVSEVTNVHMYLPRGYRENDVITAARKAARRSGRLYRRTGR